MGCLQMDDTPTCPHSYIFRLKAKPNLFQSELEVI